MGNRRTYSRKIFTFALMLICILFCLRVFHIDQDLPPWGVVTYQPVDEGQYAAPAINLQSFGVINAEDTAKTGLKYPVFTEYSLRSNLLGNYLTMASLHVLGDNYYGLRVPYVLIGLANLLLFAATLRTLQREHGSDKRDVWILLAFLVFLLVDFCFYVASRTVEPTSVRLLFIQICTLIYLKMKDSKRLRFFLLGLISVASVFLIYLTNTVLVLAMGIILLSLWYREGFKAFYKSTLWFILGAIIGWGLSELYFRAVWDIGVIENTVSALTRFAATSKIDSNYSAAGAGIVGIIALIKHAFRFFCANYLLYNLPVLCVYLMALPVLLLRCFDKKHGEHYTVFLALMLALLIQTIFFEDYIVRKFLVLIPAILSPIYLLYLDRKVEFDSLPGWMKQSNTKTAWRCFVLLMIVFIAVYRLFIVNDDTKLDFSSFDKIWIVILGLVPAVTACVAWIWFDPNKKSIKRFFWRWGYVLGVSTILLNLGMNAKHIWLNPTYSERDAMIKIADKVDHKYVFGVGYQLGYTLYNNMLPLVETPETFSEYMFDTPDSFVLDYAGEDEASRNQYDDIWFKYSDQSLMINMRLKRNFSTSGETLDMALLELAPKADIVARYRNAYIHKRIDYLDLVDEYYAAQNLSEEEKQDYWSRIDEAFAEVEAASEVYPDLHRDLLGDITDEIYVMVYGNIYGDIRAVIYGDIYGNVYGDIYVKPEGKIYGEVYGELLYSE